MLTTTALLFTATFTVVFLLGVQQLTVERGHKLAAALTSPLISLAYLVLFKLLPQQTEPIEIAGHLLGGALGIYTSMWMHPQIVALFARRPPPRPAHHAERLGETLRLAIELADDMARSDIESYCSYDQVGPHTWYDTTFATRDSAEVEAGIAKAQRYLTLRGKLLRNAEQPHLVRFER